MHTIVPEAPRHASRAAVGAAPGPGSELGRRLRLGRRRLDAAAPLPDPRLRGRLVLRVRVDADARERAGGRGSASARTARGRSPRSSRLDRGPRAEERSRRCSRSRSRRASATTRHAQGGARGAAAGGPHGHAPVPVRHVRRGLPRLGPRRSVARSAAGTRRSRSTRSPTRRSSTASARASRTATCSAWPTRRSRCRRGNPTLDVSRRAPLACSSGSSAAARPTACRAWSRASPARRRRRRRREAAALVREYGLPREALQPEHLTSAEVWEALLEDMPMTALVRNLATMTRVGVLAPGSAGTATVGRAARRRRADPRGTCAPDRACSRRSARTRRAAASAAAATWTPVREIVDALDAAFYTAFGNVEPAGTRLLLALDVSGSMAGGCGRRRAGPDARATRRRRSRSSRPRPSRGTRSSASSPASGGFRKRGPRRCGQGYTDGLTPLAISPRQRLDDVVRDGLRPAVRRHRLRAADAVRAGARAGDRHVRDLHRLGDLGGRHPPGPGAPRLPPRVGHRRTAGRGRHGLERLLDRRSRTTRECSTSSASTPRRRS